VEILSFSLRVLGADGKNTGGRSEPGRGKYLHRMADRPRNEDWWLASDGKWYPPELAPGAERPDGGGGVRGPETTAISRRLTNAVSILVAIASGSLAVSSFFGFRYASELNALGDDALAVGRDPTATELAFAGWVFLGGLVFMIAAVTSVVWVYTASRAGDARGAADRRWRGGWTIGSWVIPVANLVLPKLVFNELEKVFQVPFLGVSIEDEWLSEERTQLADLWWALWVASSVVSLGGWFVAPSETESGAVLASGITITSLTMMITATSGVFFVMVVRRIYVFSTR